MGVCMMNYVFYMPSSLPLLHIAMPTPCLNTFWHSDPYIFYIFLQNVFLSCIQWYSTDFKIMNFSHFIPPGTCRILWTDCGTNNSHLAFIQPFIRRDGSDCFANQASFRYGKSVSNQVKPSMKLSIDTSNSSSYYHIQRIEAWWVNIDAGMLDGGLISLRYMYVTAVQDVWLIWMVYLYSQETQQNLLYDETNPVHV